ncbi:MAG: hypothetical protein EOP83_12420, partial [Verrucomicrobiaceae bacterium]
GALAAGALSGGYGGYGYAPAYGYGGGYSGVGYGGDYYGSGYRGVGYTAPAYGYTATDVEDCDVERQTIATPYGRRTQVVRVCD